MDWTHQTVLVTGAGGFIGSHLTERLVALGARTRAFVRYNSAGSLGWLEGSPHREAIEVFAGDIRDPDSLRNPMRGVDIIFHLAALVAIPYSFHAPLSYVQTNVGGTLNVLQAALDAGLKLVVHTSTSEVYGTALYVPIDEKHPLQAQSPYSASKIGGDKLAEAFHLSFGLPVTVVRPFNTYGPRQSARAVIPTIVTQALTKPVIYLGNVNPTRDFNYVSDIVEGFICAAQCPRAVGQVINLGSGREISVQDVAAAILKLLGKDAPVVCDGQRVRPETSEVERLCADYNKAREILIWEPRHALLDGLQQTIAWIQKKIECYRAGVYAI